MAPAEIGQVELQINFKHPHSRLVVPLHFQIYLEPVQQVELLLAQSTQQDSNQKLMVPNQLEVGLAYFVIQITFLKCMCFFIRKIK